MICWDGLLDNFYQRFDARNEEDKHRKLMAFEKKKLFELLLKSDDSVIKSVRNEALVAVKLAGRQYYGDEYDKLEKYLTSEIVRYNKHRNNIKLEREIDAIYEEKCNMLDEINKYIAEYYKEQYNTINEIDTEDSNRRIKSIINKL